MTPTLTQNLKFQIWPGHGKVTDPHPHPKFKISDLAWTWKDDPPLQQISKILDLAPFHHIFLVKFLSARVTL